MKNTKLKRGLFLVCLCFALGSVQNLQAQPGFGPGGDDVNDEVAAPIDGFIGIALAVGAYFGGRELKRKKKE